MFNINPLRFFRRTQAVVAEAYRGASKMGKGKKLKSSDVTADFEKFENFFYQDSHVFGIITCIADSMSESGLSFVHSDRDTSDQANNMVSEYEMDTWSRSSLLRTWCSGTHLPYLIRQSQTLTSWSS